MKRIHFGLSLILIILFTTIIGCGGGGGSSDTTTTTAENSTYGEYTIAGKSVTTTPEDENILDEQLGNIALLEGSIQTIDYYMVRYDTNDSLGWIAISPNKTIVYKLDGVDANGELVFTALQGDGVVSFTDLYFNAEVDEITFGSVVESSDTTADIINAIANKSFDIQGYLVKYNSNSDSSWLFVTGDTSYVGILDGGDGTSNIPLWREIHANEEVARTKSKITSKNKKYNGFSNVQWINSGISNQTITGDYYNILFGNNRKVSSSVSMTPSLISLSNGESVTFSVSIKNNITNEENAANVSDNNLSWTVGPTLTCNETTINKLAVAQGSIEAADFAVGGQLVCPDNFETRIWGVNTLFVDESSKLIAESQVVTRLDNNVSVSYVKEDLVQWSSSDSSIATVSADGLVTCKQNGSANITAVTPSNKTATEPMHCVTKYLLKMSGPSRLYVDKDGVFKAKVTSKDGVYENAEISYSSSNTSVVSIDPQTGIATCLKGNESTSIKATFDNPTEDMVGNSEVKATLFCKEKEIPKFRVIGGSILYIHETAQYDAYLKDNFKQTSKVTNQSAWSSQNTSVATVNIQTGLVTCEAVGSSEIRALHVYADYMYSSSDIIECENQTTTDTEEEVEVEGIEEPEEEPTEEPVNYCVPEGPGYFSGVVTTPELEEASIHFYNLMFGTEADSKIPASGSAWMPNSNWAGTDTGNFTDDKFWFTFESGEAYINTTTGRLVINFPSGSTFNGSLGQVANGDCYPGGPIENPDGTTDNVSMDYYEQTDSDPGAQ